MRYLVAYDRAGGDHRDDERQVRLTANTPAVMTMVSAGTTGKNPSSAAHANNAR